MNRTIQTRIFLVGCPRSGTTILQSLLAANSMIASFPETHFFERLFSGRKLLSVLGIASRKARPHWKVMLEEIGHLEMNSILPRYAIFVHQFSAAFVEVLDTLATSQGKPVWLEKTPRHLHYVDQIDELVSSARFVHILRNGEDNIASLFEVGKTYPEDWRPRHGTLDLCIQRWVTDTRISLRCSSRNNHYLLRYEQLIANPIAELVAVCEFMGVPFEESMLCNYPVAARQLILQREPWKASVSEPIRTTGRSKFEDFLNEEQRQNILDHIPADLTDFLRYENEK